jgi:cell pole-organizing protein PopZ
MIVQQPGEPSVEEILDSIKKVIARDNRDGAIAERRERARGERPAARQDARSEPVEPADADEAEEVLELDEDAMVARTDRGESEDSEPEQGDEDAPLTTEALRTSMQANFAALAMLAEPGAAPQIVRSGETSLEGLVREMLRPMLAQWLDTNLPPMVEKLVKDEITRIAGKRS